MLSSISDFPSDELISQIRESQSDYEQFLAEIRKMNMNWIYQTVSHLYNFIVQSKESPTSKLNALKLAKEVFQTCEIPCISLLQVYLVPILYEIAAYNPKQENKRKNSRFFIDEGYSYRIPNIQETSVEFVCLATQMLLVFSITKKKRTLNNQELNQESESVYYYNKACEKNPNALIELENLKYFEQKSALGLHKKYLIRLSLFQIKSEEYVKFLILKMLNSLQTEKNHLFSAKAKNYTSLSNDLDFKKLLKSGDTYVTSPLLHEIMDGLISSDNFIVKRNYLSLLSDMVKWADIEALVQIIYGQNVELISIRIAQIDGHKGMNEGQKIYSQIKGQAEAKRKFYIQFLKCIQLWAHLVEANQNAKQEQRQKLLAVYRYFKVQRKFIFPENIMLKVILEDYINNLQKNYERNKLLLTKLELDSNSLLLSNSSLLRRKNSKQSSSIIKKSSRILPQKKSFHLVKEQLDKCLEHLASLCDDEEETQKKIQQLNKFKRNFDVDLQNLKEVPNDDEVLNMINDADQIIQTINILESLFDDYIQKNMNFTEFTVKYKRKLEISQNNIPSNILKSQDIHNSQAQQFIESRQQKQQKKISNLEVLQNSSCISEKIVTKQESFQNYKRVPNQRSSFQSELNLEKPQQQIISMQDKNQKSITIANQEEIHNQTFGNQDSQKKIKQPPSFKDIFNQNDFSPFISKKSFDNKQSVLRPTLNKNTILNSQKSSILSSPADHKKSQSKQGSRVFYYKHTQLISQNENKKISKSEEDSKIPNQIKKTSQLIAEGNYEISKQNWKTQTNQEQKEMAVGKSNYLQQSQDSVGLQKNEFIQAIKQQNSYIQSQIIDKNQQNSRLSGQKSDKRVNKIKLNRSYSRQSRRSSRSLKKQSKQSQLNAIEKASNEYFVAKDSGKKPKNVLGISKIQKQVQINQNHNEYSQIQGSQNSPKQSSKISINSNTFTKKLQKNNQLIKAEIDIDKKNQILTDFQRGDKKESNKRKKIFIQKPSPIKPKDTEPQSMKLKVAAGSQILQEQNIKIYRDKQLQIHNLESFHDYQLQVFKNKSKNYQFNLRAQEQGYLSLKNRPKKNERKDNQLDQMKNRINLLKNQTSRMRFELSQRSSQCKSKQFSQSSKSSEYDKDGKKYRRNNSYDSVRADSLRILQESKHSINSKHILSINHNKFQGYFSRDKSNQLKKSLLKQKCLIEKINKIEFGSQVRLEEQNTVKLILFITPEFYISNLSYKISKDRNLKIKSFPEIFEQIKTNQQVRLSLIIEMKSFPYNLPEIVFTYTMQNSIQTQKIKLSLPVSPHRFLVTNSISNVSSFKEQFEEGNIYSTKQIKINRKVLKIENLLQYFCSLQVLKKEDKITEYGMMGNFHDSSFLLKYLIKGSTYMEIQGKVRNVKETISKKQSEFLQYIIASLSDTIQSVHKDK